MRVARSNRWPISLSGVRDGGVYGVWFYAWLALAALTQAAPVIENRQNSISDGSVRVELCERNVQDENAWPLSILRTYEEEAFAFFRLPQRYIKPGIRGDYPNPLLVRAVASISLPEGRHRILLRSRRAARLWMNDVLIGENPFPNEISDGHDPVERPFLKLGSDVRFAAPGDQECLTEIEVEEGSQHFRLEFFVGGFAKKKPLRPETGETLVAVSLEGQSDFKLLAPRLDISLTDESWLRFETRQHHYYDQLDTQTRRRLADLEQDYWNKRHQHARDVFEKKHRPSGSRLESSSDTIDVLIDQRIAAANKTIESSPITPNPKFTRAFEILKDRCFSCHGKKAKGGLRIDSGAALLAGGDSGEPAVMAGNANASLLIARVSADVSDDPMPPKGDRLSADEIAALRDWIDSGASWPRNSITKPITHTARANDLAFLRRVHLDTIGIPPASHEIRNFLGDDAPAKRSRLIDKLLADPRWADHWVSYWQDVLAENPTVVNPTLNNTGPFRWWIYESFLDNKPMDRFVTDLVMMEGSLHGGGPAGFSMASQNDVPMAAKANILSTAFLATEMKCSRCHDAPFHDNKQEDLFAIAAMLARQPIRVPPSSSVPLDKLHTGGRHPLISVSLDPGSEVSPTWPFKPKKDSMQFSAWLKDPHDTREQLAFHITDPANSQFPQVVVNRLWRRLMGHGIVEPAHDWETAEPSHPALLDFLAHELVVRSYDLKHVTRLILNSQAYQRMPSLDEMALAYFVSPAQKRMTAEQIVDSLFSVTGQEMRTEELNIDVNGGRPWSSALNLGEPHRAWMFGGMANNRDRPSLILPRAQAVMDVLTAFGWRSARHEPTTSRKDVLTPLQPAILNNGIAVGWLTRLSDSHGITTLCRSDLPLEQLIEEVYLRILNRFPTPNELEEGRSLLTPGYIDRFRETKPKRHEKQEPPLFVTWANHLHPKATTVQLALARAARLGNPPTQALNAHWRERMEDYLWALINLPETIHYP